MNPLRAWNVFWFRPVSARPLAAFRIAFGLAVLVHVAFLIPQADYWLSDAGLLVGSEARELAGPIRLSPMLYWQSPLAARVFLGATTVAALLVIAGWRTRAATVLLYLCLLSIHHRNLMSASSADVLIVALAFYLMFSPAGAAYSLDARREAKRRGGTEAEPIIIPWAMRLIQLQVGLVYLMSASVKSAGRAWLDGSALHYVLSNGEIRRYTFGLTDYPMLTSVMTHGALVMEFSLAFLLWSRAARPWVILGGIGLHVGIMLTVNIPVFGEMMIASYLTFLDPDQLDTLLRRIDPRPSLAALGRTVAAAGSLAARPGGIRFDPPDAPRGPHRPAGVRQLTLGFVDRAD